MLSTFELKYNKSITFFVLLLFTIYIGSVGLLCFYPLTADLNRQTNNWETFRLIGKAPVITTPFIELNDFSFYLNILMTVPFGMFMITLFKKYTNFFSLAVISLAVGSFIESTQFLLDNLNLMTRFADINDVIANAVGVLLGYFLALGGFRLLQKVRFLHQNQVES